MPEKSLQITPGQMIGPYRTIEFIARGGFSEVWSAWDNRLTRLVAIKLSARLPDDYAETMMFGREAAAIALLQHPNIVPLYDYGQTPDVRYLVTRYVVGGSLAQLATKKHLEVTALLPIMRYVAEALDYVHARNIVHRDLKPGNVLIDDYDVAYLSDFGLAYQLEEGSQRVHSASGTPPYMPPEQLSGGAVTTYSDQFSFGIMLFELLTGTLPFDGKQALGMQQLASREVLPDPRLINPNLPAAITPILRSLTAVDATARPAILAPVIDSLVEVLSIHDETLVLPTGAGHNSLDSRRYLEAEKANLLNRALVRWEQGEFDLTLTHLILLNVLTSDERSQQSAAAQSLMLRGALEYDQQVGEWWADSSSEARQRACFHAIKHGDKAVKLRALALITPTPLVSSADAETLDAISGLLTTDADAAPAALEFFERVLPASSQWTDDARFAGVDRGLASLANADSPHRQRAAALIGRFRRTRAFADVSSLSSQLAAYDIAGSLPAATPGGQRLSLALRLMALQLTRRPGEWLRHYAWAALGCSVGLGYMIFVVYRTVNFLSSRQILNTLGNGLLFGLIYGLALWLSRHIAENCRALPRGWRLLLAIAVGALVFAFGATLYVQLLLDDVIDFGVALLSGVLFVSGFALSVGMVDWMQFIAGAAGVIAAFLIPWSNYLNDGTSAPFVFDYTDPNSAIPLALVGAILMSAITLGYLWLSRRSAMLSRRAKPPVIVADEPVIDVGKTQIG